MILRPGNLPGWWDFPIRDRLSERIGLPVTFANDANAAAYGEYWLGAGQFHSMVLLTLGTGVGGGIIVGETMIEGEHSCGGECGHIVVDPRDDAPADSAGIRGSLEAYANASAIVDRVTEASRRAKSARWPDAARRREDHAFDRVGRSGSGDNWPAA